MRKNYLLKTSAVILSAFGLITLILSLSIFFNLFGVREMEGNYVLFVVIANFICSILHLQAGIGLWKQKSWATTVIGSSIVLLIVAFIAFSVYAANGGLHEQKTYGALVFRTAFTAVFFAISYFSFKKTR